MAKRSLKLKDTNCLSIHYTPHLPNEFHRKAKWSAGRIHKNKKKYNRKLILLDNSTI